MDAYKAIISKRDRREYDARPIPEESLQRILQAGRMAGSSSNSQPCRFIVMRDRSVLEALAPFGRGTGPLLHAPLVIAVVLKEGARDFDVGRAVQNMFVAAWSEGIISCPAGVQDKEGARRVLGIPEGFELSICAAFGYPVEGSPASRGQARLPLAEIVHWERW